MENQGSGLTKDEILQALYDQGMSEEEIKAAISERLKKKDPGFLAKFMSGLKDDALVITSAEMGRMAGSVFGPQGAAAGTAIGGAIGEAATMAGTGLERLAGVPEGETTFNRPDPKSVGEAIMQPLKAGAEQLAGQKVGEKVVDAAGKVLSPFASKVSGATKRLGEKFTEVGGRFSVGQQTDKSVATTLENVARSSYTGGGRMREFLDDQYKHVEAFGKKVAGMFTSSLGEAGPNQSGRLFMNTIQGGRDAHRMASQKLFNELRDSAGEIKVDVSSLRELAKKEADAFKRISNIGKTDQGGSFLDKLSNVGEGVKQTAEQKAAKVPEAFKLDFADAHALRSNLLDMLRGLGGEEAKAKRLVKETLDQVDAAMETAAKEAGGDTFEMWRRANKFYRVGKKSFDNDFMATLLNDKRMAEDVGEQLFKSGNVTEIIQAKRALQNAKKFAKAEGQELNADDTWNAMLTSFNREMIDKHSKSGALDAAALLRDFNNPKVKRTMQAAFSPEQYQALRDFADIAAKSQKKLPGGGDVLIQLTQSGVIVSAATAALAPEGQLKDVATGSAAVFLLGPNIIARAFTNPTMVRWLTNGLQTPKSSKAAAGLATRILSTAFKDRQGKEDLQVIQMPDIGTRATIERATR